jgi:hypothetical protein
MARPRRPTRRASRFEREAWLYPAAVVAHVAEEAPGFTKWARRFASPRYSERDFLTINAAAIATALAGTALVTRVADRRVQALWWTTLLTQQSLWNAAFHVGTTAAWRTYSPGLVTSVALGPPLWYRLTRLALAEGRLTRRAAAVGLAAAAALHAAAVAQQVFYVGRGPRRRERV